MLKILTKVEGPHFKGPRSVDCHSCQQRREDVHDDPVAPALHLPVVVGSADCQVPLNTHSNDEKDATADTDPEEKVVQ